MFELDELGSSIPTAINQLRAASRWTCMQNRAQVVQSHALVRHITAAIQPDRNDHKMIFINPTPYDLLNRNSTSSFCITGMMHVNKHAAP